MATKNKWGPAGRFLFMFYFSSKTGVSLVVDSGFYVKIYEYE